MGLLAGDGSPMGLALFRGPTHGSMVGPNPRPAVVQMSSYLGEGRLRSRVQHLARDD